jgi:serine/threonine protein phosphatase PrpC
MFFRAAPAPAPRGEATTFEELLVMETADHGPRTGSADARGWRPSMEDAVVVDVHAVPGALALAIFDGHGGAGVSAAGAAALGPRLKALCATRPPSQYLAEVFPALDAAIHSSSGTTFDSTGSTAVCVVVTSQELACGWLGDSKALLGTSSDVVALSTDHKRP